MSLTKVSYSMINGAPVNIADFIPAGSITNYDTYIQNAIDYCILNFKDLYVDRIYPLTGQITINRSLVDDSGNPIDTYDYTTMTIFSDCGGGFSVSTATAGMFKCTKTYSGAPYRPTTENIVFSNLTFRVDDASRNAWVIQGGTSSTPTFLRTTFQNCTFEKIKLVNDVYGSYLQSWYLIDCIATLWEGNFVHADRSFDIQIIGGRYEGTVSGNCFYLTNTYGSKIWTQIESVSDTAILLNASYGVDISCYFEANGRDVDTISPINPALAAQLGTYYTSGINIHGSKFTGSDDTNYPCVTWNTNCRSCVSSGNVGAVLNNSYLHFIDGTNFTSGQTIEINDYADGTGTVSSFDAYSNSGLRRSDAPPASFSVSAVSNTNWFTNGNTTFVYSKSGAFVNINFITTLTATTNTSDNALIIENFGYAPTGTATGYMVGMVTVGTTAYPLVTASDASIRTLVNALPATLTGGTLTVRACIAYPSSLQ